MQTETDEPVAYPYQRLRLQGDYNVQIRILIVEPSADSSTPIVCRLVVTYIEERPVFETLSYTWGEPTDTVAITIEGYEVPITRNLYGALKACRSQSTSRRLWVDAICINQDDVREKSNLVRNMHVFYYYSTRTVIWLGEATNDSDLALDIVVRAGRDFKARETTEELAILNSMANEPSSQETKMHWTALSNLFGRLYWTRAWIVQENMYSRDAIVKCAQREIPMQWLIQTSVRLFGSPAFIAFATSNPKRFMRLRGMRAVVLIFTLRERVRAWISKGDSQSLWPLGTVLSSLRYFDSTDPRDKIFGCMMLSARPAGFDLLDVDYSQACGELYATVARRLIEQDSSLRILSSCDTFGHGGGVGDIAGRLTPIDGLKRIQIPNLPSWAPNWAIRRVSGRFLGDYEEAEYDLEFLDRPDLMGEPYRASGDLSAQFEFSDDGTSLTVKGHILDGVLHRSEIPYGKSVVDCFKQMVEVCRRSPNAGGGYPLKPSDAMLITMTGNRNALGQRLSTMERAALTAGWATIIKGGPLSIGIKDRMQDNGIRIFFTTIDGYMGFGPLALEAHDRVCLIRGCYVPMILRGVKVADGVEVQGSVHVTHAETSFYRVVGPAYVLGVMEGEVAALLEGDNLTDFVLR